LPQENIQKHGSKPKYNQKQQKTQQNTTKKKVQNSENNLQ